MLNSDVFVSVKLSTTHRARSGTTVRGHATYNNTARNITFVFDKDIVVLLTTALILARIMDHLPTNRKSNEWSFPGKKKQEEFYKHRLRVPLSN